MIFSGHSVEEVVDQVNRAATTQQPIKQVQLPGLARVLEHHPEDLTVTVEAGLSLAGLQEALARHRQWLPLDPPFPESTSIGELLNENFSGPRRYGFGTIRDYLIGIKVILADGSVIRSGGKVVKNVAGFDLARLFIGSRGSLGVIVEATFKLLPLPEAEAFLSREIPANEINQWQEKIVNAAITPSVFDLYRESEANKSSPRLIIGFSGGSEEVCWQVEQFDGFQLLNGLQYARDFFQKFPACKISSLLGSELEGSLQQCRNPFLVRAGNGVVYHTDSLPPLPQGAPVALADRLKAEFDPKRIFPDLPLSR